MRMVMMIMMALSIASAPLAANPPLREVAEIDDGLLAIGLADAIRKTCPTISARMVRAYIRLNELKDRALALGYTPDEIKAYIRSDAEKDRMRGRGRAYLKANGVVEGDVQGYCALGRAEIEKSSLIGKLLRAE